MSELPLSGYRVVDFCWLAAGPVMTRLLADLGADVIKVESMARLDRIREVGPQPTGRPSMNTNGLFNTCNANKRSITLNLGGPEGIAIARQLIEQADIVTSNFTPNRMDRWGLGYDDVRQIKPDIIMVSLPVMGKVGPRSGWGSYGNGIVAMCGLGAATGAADREPVGLGTLHTDFSIPYLAATQVISALIDREQTGKGQFIEVAQYEAATHLLDTELYEYLLNGHEPARRGNRSREYAPHGVFPAAGDDRWIALTVRNQFEWEALCTVIGCDDLLHRADLKSFEGRQAAQDELEAAISAWSATMEPGAACTALLDAGVPAAPVCDIGDLMSRRIYASEHFVCLDHPEETDILIENEPVTWDGERLPVRLAPLMGEHNEEVLNERLGITGEAFVDLLVNQTLY